MIFFQSTSYSFEEDSPEIAREICVTLQSPSELSIPFNINFSVQQGTASKISVNMLNCLSIALHRVYTAVNDDYSVSGSPLIRQFTVSDRVGAVKCISVRIVNDNTSDPEETFTVRISSPDLRVEIRQDSVTVTIIDDDGML